MAQICIEIQYRQKIPEYKSVDYRRRLVLIGLNSRIMEEILCKWETLKATVGFNESGRQGTSRSKTVEELVMELKESCVTGM